ncbi:AI-2E family transporter [Flavobacterium sp. IMCC34852]|uniref:AI-2E family transporter n=1 Tax=Flavobacterium rivulicola TaxID=2732161 RepID=A0A7Y3R9D5_9FLAO|nr:AI-2E family transporter [Flavobacterium sp. IMCC34852]NNT72309.1 AI-2E family transporter [Flavobacterium sp. IMCC34852]
MVTSKTIALGIVKGVGIIVLTALALYFLYQIQAVLIYLVVAFILTLIGNPILDFFKRKLKFNHIAATIATLTIFMLLIFGLLSMFIPLITAQGENLSLLNTTEIEKSTLELINKIAAYLDSHGIDSSRLFKEANISSKINFSFIPELFNSIILTISSFGIGLASVLFITFFFLKDRLSFIISAKHLMPDAQEDKILNSLHQINHLLSRYFIGLLLQLFIVFILYMIVLLIFGVENAILIAFLCAVLNIVPYIGPLIASVVAAILTMLGNLGGDFQTQILPVTIYVMIGFWIVQLIDNNVSSPLIFSKSVSSHPLEIFLVVLITGFLFGIVGMIIAIPFYTILKVFGKEFFPENKIIKLLTKNL